MIGGRDHSQDIRRLHLPHPRRLNTAGPHPSLRESIRQYRYIRRSGHYQDRCTAKVIFSMNSICSPRALHYGHHYILRSPLQAIKHVSLILPPTILMGTSRIQSASQVRTFHRAFSTIVGLVSLSVSQTHGQVGSPPSIR